MKKPGNESTGAEVVALNALRYLAEDGDRLGRFLALSGASPADLSAMIGEPAFLGGVLDFLLQDESLLVEFAEAENLAPERLRALRARLPGREIDG